MDPRFPRGGGLPSGPQSGVRPPQRPLQTGLASPASGPPAQTGQMTRADRFEDEKKRIMESLFFKMDEKGQLAESYITHIKVTEDSSYPQTPHPPDSPSANKERMIIIAVRNTGRVRLHKARENANKSFSIGKTWNMEELTGVQSWSHFEPRNEEEATFKKWAGDVGFSVTVAKQYYWQAGTDKEKEFFIASLVKIFKKYTQGRLPELVGFSAREMTQMTAEPASQSRATSAASAARPPQLPPFSPDRGFSGDRSVTPQSKPEPPFGSPQTPDSPANQPIPLRNRPPTSNSDRPAFFQQRSPSGQSQTPPNGGFYGSQDPARQPRQKPSQEGNLRQPPSREPLRPIGAPTNGSFTSLSSSRSDFGQQRNGTPDSTGSRQTSANTVERSPSRTPEVMLRNGEQLGPNGLGIVSPAKDRWRPNGAPPGQPGQDFPKPLRPVNGFTSQPNGSQSSLGEQQVPERRRPLMVANQMNGSQSSFAKGPTSQPAVPVPLGARKDASSDNLLGAKQERMPGAFIPSPLPSEKIEQEGLLPKPLKVSLTPNQGEFAQPTKLESESAPAVKDPSAQLDGENKEELKKGDELDTSRPGLGRMFGGQKKSARDLFKSAANAYGAFVPRAGGAAAKIKATETKETNEPDGISGVVPAPGLLRTRTDDSMKVDTPTTEGSIQQTPTSALAANPLDSIPPPPEPVPQVTVSSPISPLKETEQNFPQQSLEDPKAPAINAQQKKAKEAEEETARRKKRRSAQQMKYLSILGVDSTILENKGLDFEMMLDDFGWGTSVFQPKNIDVLETDIRREISRVEAGSWLGHLEQKDDRVEAVEKLLDKAIAEVDELDGLLTLYSVELSSLNDDIAFIEAQSQGLQVQTANQKLLQTELQNLVDTISITPQQLDALKRASPNKSDGLVSIENALLTLYRAMITINPAIRQGPKSVNNASTNNELSSMTALQDKSDQYLNESALFLKRFSQFMDMTFGAAFMDAKDIIEATNKNTKLNSEPHDAARATLWQYSPLILFAKEIEPDIWSTLMTAYQVRARPVYQEEFKGNAQAWKQLARKSTGDEQEILFTFNEKEDATLTGTARKLTVKRSQTLARGLRAASGEKDKLKKIPSGTLWPFEAFSGALDEWIPLISVEQNFIVDFFHATGTLNIDFADAVSAAPPDARRGTNLYARKAFEPDRLMAGRITAAMEDMYSFLPTELQSLIEWAISADPLQGIGVMYALHRNIVSFEDSNQEFLTKTLMTITTALAGRWSKFVDEQIRAIEDTKVKIKKRKGVIGFIKTFPNFSAAIENMLPAAIDEPAESSEVRNMVDVGYTRINKAMFESLRVIAKESPGMAGASGGASSLQAMGSADPEDKEALNYHILLIENMNHYVEEVETRGDVVLEGGKNEAKEEMGEHMAMYVDAVIRRPLGKVIDFLDSLTHTLSTLPPGTPPTALASRPSTSPNVYRKLLASALTDQKELRRGIEALRKRIDKHFGDSDDPNLSRDLVGKVLGACETAYVDVFQRVQDVGREVYEGEAGDGVLGTREEVGRWFRGGR